MYPATLPEPYVSKPVKFFFITALSLHSLFYCILMVMLSMHMHTSLVSGTVNITMSVLAGLLFLKSFFSEEYKLNIYVGAAFFYMVQCCIVLLFYTGQTEGWLSQFGKLGDYYYLLTFGIGTYLLYFLDKGRFLYLANRPMIIFIPTLLSVAATLLLFGDMLSDENVLYYMHGSGVSRSTIKIPPSIMFVISICWVAFYDKKWKLFLGLGGLLLSSYMIYVSTSQSLILSVFATCAVLFLLSIKNRTSLFRVLMLYFGGAVVAIPALLASKGWERLMTIFSLKEEYLLGGSYDTSRIDLIKDGWRLFLESPLLGGTITTSSGVNAHCFFIDTLMTGGLLAGVTMCIILWGCFKGAKLIYRNGNQNYYWIILLAVFMFTQYIFHGSYISLISPYTAFLLSAIAIFSTARGKL